MQSVLSADSAFLPASASRLAFFYVGLGTALFIAGLRYLENVLHFGRYDVEDRTV